MSDLEREPMAIGILNDLIDFAKQTPHCTGQVSYTLEDGRTILIAIRPPELNMQARETA